MKIIFLGTADFAATVLQRLSQSQLVDVSLIISRPPAASHRGGVLTNSPAVETALKLGLTEHDIITPLTLQGAELQQAELALQKCRPDFIVTAAYGLIIPDSLLCIANYCAINVHASLLPRWRGAAPIERAILAGDEYTGVSIMQMTAGLDEGPVATSTMTLIGDKSTAVLTQELAELGADLLLQVLPTIIDGSVKWTAQSKDNASYAEKVQKGELNLSPELNALENVRRVQASSDSHTCKMRIDTVDLRVLMASVANKMDCHGSTKLDLVLPRNDVVATSPATRTHNDFNSIQWNGESLLATCSDGSQFEIIELQKPGKQPTTAQSFVNGHPLLRDQRVLAWTSD